MTTRQKTPRGGRNPQADAKSSSRISTRSTALTSSIAFFSSAIVAAGVLMPACAQSAPQQKKETPIADAATEAAAVIDAAPYVDAALPPALDGRSFVAHNVYLGDTDLDGGADPLAWQQFGTNIDGKTTTIDSSDVCTPPSFSNGSNQIDGIGGVDNSFGKNVLPIFASLGVVGFSASLTESIASGGPSLLVNLQSLTDDPHQSASNLNARLLSVVHDTKMPTWATDDTWSIYASSLVSGTIPSGAKTVFPKSQITSGTWSSGGVGDVSLTLAFGGFTLDVVVHHATVSFTHASAHHVSGGIVSGVVKTSELLTAVQIVLEQSGACAYSPEIVPQIQAASDIMQYGTNDSGQTCDGISIGMGFDAEEIAPPDVVAPDPIPGSGCP